MSVGLGFAFPKRRRSGRARAGGSACSASARCSPSVPGVTRKQEAGGAGQWGCSRGVGVRRNSCARGHRGRGTSIFRRRGTRLLAPRSGASQAPAAGLPGIVCGPHHLPQSARKAESRVLSQHFCSPRPFVLGSDLVLRGVAGSLAWPSPGLWLQGWQCLQPHGMCVT